MQGSYIFKQDAQRKDKLSYKKSCILSFVKGITCNVFGRTSEFILSKRYKLRSSYEYWFSFIRDFFGIQKSRISTAQLYFLYPLINSK